LVCGDIEKDEIGGACGPYGAVRNLVESDRLKDLGVYGKMEK
jgi:hypothetical protein